MLNPFLGGVCHRQPKNLTLPLQRQENGKTFFSLLKNFATNKSNLKKNLDKGKFFQHGEI